MRVRVGVASQLIKMSTGLMIRNNNGFFILRVMVVAAALLIGSNDVVEGNAVFKVEHKFGGRKSSRLRDLAAHDHGRMLSSIDLPLGGHRLVSIAGLYYTKLSIGTPPQDYRFHVDTGSDVSWMNCADNQSSERNSSLGFKLHPYNVNASSTGKVVTYEQDWCPEGSIYPAEAGEPCGFSISYMDNSSASGYYVKDRVSLDQVSGEYQTEPINETMIFGCSTHRAGHPATAEQRTDGLIGLSPMPKMSFIAQLADLGLVKKMVSHCLDGHGGGGIFVLGEVVDPKVNKTSLVPDSNYYVANIKEVEVGNEMIVLGSHELTPTQTPGSSFPAVIDSGSTFARLPAVIYDELIRKITAQHPDLEIKTDDEWFAPPMECFKYNGDVNDGFPTVVLHFDGDGGLIARVYPHDYLFENTEAPGQWCFGWQRGGLMLEGIEAFSLGAVVLANKLVLYNLEEGLVGWTEYNCSSTIVMKDEGSGQAYTVGAFSIDASPLYSAQSPLPNHSDVSDPLSRKHAATSLAVPLSLSAGNLLKTFFFFFIPICCAYF